MQHSALKRFRKSVRLRPEDLKKLNDWAAEFHTKEDARFAFSGETGIYLRALPNLLKNKSAREDVVERALEIIKKVEEKKQLQADESQ